MFLLWLMSFSSIMLHFRIEFVSRKFDFTSRAKSLGHGKTNGKTLTQKI